jgi:hypothetical protein
MDSIREELAILQDKVSKAKRNQKHGNGSTDSTGNDTTNGTVTADSSGIGIIRDARGTDTDTNGSANSTGNTGNGSTGSNEDRTSGDEFPTLNGNISAIGSDRNENIQSGNESNGDSILIEESNGTVDTSGGGNGDNRERNGTGGDSTRFGGIEESGESTGRFREEETLLIPSMVNMPESIFDAKNNTAKPTGTGRKPGRPRKNSSSDVTEEFIEATVETIFGFMQFARGPHWNVTEGADLSVISKPAKRMIDRMPQSARESLEKYVDPAMLLFGLFLLAQPAIQYELAIARGQIRPGDIIVNGNTNQTSPPKGSRIHPSEFNLNEPGRYNGPRGTGEKGAFGDLNQY